jgi:ABC-type nitrate/sulfonate/bicarbonate transport system substrate-binding protein
MALMNRREMLQRTLELGGVAAFLAACGSSTKAAPGGTTVTTAAGAATTAAPATTAGAATTAAPAGAATTAAMAAAKDLGPLSVRLSWIKNVEFAGSYMADAKGFFKANGFSSVDLIAGGPSATASEVEVSSGKALVGISSPDLLASAIGQGGKLMAIGAEYQKNPFCVMSLASKPILKPEDMYGKKFGLQAANQAVWDAFVAASGIDDSKIIKFPAQFDPTPLVQGQADCWFSFVTNEPNTLKTQGIETKSFLLADFGYPLVSEIYVVKTENLKAKRAELKAFLKSQIEGWHAVYKNPKEAAELTVSVYGKDLGLDVAEQTLEAISELELIFTPETMKDGILTISDKLIGENIAVLGKAGLKIKAEELFDLSLLKEVYAENPGLMAPPAK